MTRDAVAIQERLHARSLKQAFVDAAVARYNYDVERARRDLMQEMAKLDHPDARFWGNPDGPRGYHINWHTDREIGVRANA